MWVLDDGPALYFLIVSFGMFSTVVEVSTVRSITVVRRPQWPASPALTTQANP